MRPRVKQEADVSTLLAGTSNRQGEGTSCRPNRKTVLPGQPGNSTMNRRHDGAIYINEYANENLYQHFVRIHNRNLKIHAGERPRAGPPCQTA